MATEKFWTLNQEALGKTKESSKKKVKKTEKENIPVSVSRVVKFLNENKGRSFTNWEIAQETGLSSSSVSGITDRLENIGAICQGRNRKALDKTTIQTYQSALTGTGYSKERVGGQEVIVQVREAFDKNKNKVYTRKEIQDLIKSTSEKVGKAIQILLVVRMIKLVGFDKKKKVLQYQSIKGNKRAVDVSEELDENYSTLTAFLTKNKITGSREKLAKIKEQVEKGSGHARLFYLNTGITKMYEIEYLKRVISGEECGIIEKLRKLGRK